MWGVFRKGGALALERMQTTQTTAQAGAFISGYTFYTI
jgi:hypothetical protein